MKTYGYNFAFALSIDAVNAIMAKNLAGVDMSIAYASVDEDSGAKLTLNATLGPWQLAPGGENNLINLNLPIVKGAISLQGAGLSGTYDLAGVVPEMQVTLGWVGAGSAQDATGSGDKTRLSFNPTESSDKNGQGYVATLQVHDPQKKLSAVALGILSDVMAKALYSNKDKIKYIFANVNPIPRGLASWLRPSEWRYFYVGTPTNGALCFLCMLSGSSAMPQAPSFDSTALKAGSNTAILISQPVFFENIVVPGVHAAFPGANFQLSTTTEEVCTVNNSGEFQVDNVPAQAFKLTPSNDGNGLALTASGGGPLKFLFGAANLPNASYHWSLSTVSPLQFDGKMLRFAKDANPVMTQDHTIPWYDWILLVVLGVVNITGLISLIYDSVNHFGDRAETVGMANINAGLQNATQGSVANLAALVDWSVDGRSLTPQDAGTSGALYVHGNLG